MFLNVTSPLTNTYYSSEDLLQWWATQFIKMELQSFFCTFSVTIFYQKYSKIPTMSDKHRLENNQLPMQKNQWEYQQKNINNLITVNTHSHICHRQHWLVTIVLWLLPRKNNELQGLLGIFYNGDPHNLSCRNFEYSLLYFLSLLNQVYDNIRTNLDKLRFNKNKLLMLTNQW